MKNIIVIVIISLLVLISPIFSIVIRVRLSNGLMHRIDINDENNDSNSNLKKFSINELKRLLKEKSLITDSSIISINGDSSSNSQEWISAKDGEIVDIIEPTNKTEIDDTTTTTTTKEPKKFIRKVSSFDTASSSTSTSSTTTSSSSISKKKVASIADIEKFRGSLEKISPQKNGGNSSVAISPMAGKILKRLANGGCGLLLGKIIKKDDNNNDKKISKVGRLQGIGDGAGKKVKKTEDPKECIEIYAVCEICFNNDYKFPDNLDTLTTTSSICKIANGLGLSIVGCCVGLGKDEMWSPEHIRIGLKLHKIANNDIINNNKFVVLSSSNADDNVNTNKASKDKKRKRFAVKQSGLSLEAFRLSDQTYRLFEKGTISLSIDNSNSDSIKNTKGKKIPENDENNNKELLQLQGPVLTGNSNEAKAIDPLLFAVPLPIIQIGSITNSNSNRNSNINDFEHSFPTVYEIENDEKLKKAANIHLYRTLGNLNNNDTKNRLRDPHMLMFLANIVDENSLLALCKSIVDPKSPGISAAVKMALEMARSVMEPIGKRGRKDDDNNDNDDD